jgi:hypothetical protein
VLIVVRLNVIILDVVKMSDVAMNIVKSIVIRLNTITPSVIMLNVITLIAVAPCCEHHHLAFDLTTAAISPDETCLFV